MYTSVNHSGNMNRARVKKNHTYNLTTSPKSGHVRGRVMLNIGTMNFAKKRWLWEYLKTIDGALFFFFFFPARSGHVFIFFFRKIEKSECSVFYGPKTFKNGTIPSKSGRLASMKKTQIKYRRTCRDVLWHYVYSQSGLKFTHMRFIDLSGLLRMICPTYRPLWFMWFHYYMW